MAILKYQLFIICLGMLADHTGSYKWTFILSGTVGLLSLAVAMLTNNLAKLEHEQNQSQQSGSTRTCGKTGLIAGTRAESINILVKPDHTTDDMK